MGRLNQLRGALLDFFDHSQGEIALKVLMIIGQIILLTLILQLAKKLTAYFFSKKFPTLFHQDSKVTVNPQRITTLSRLMNNAIIYILYFIYSYIFLTLLGFPIGTLLAGAGIAGVALGMGAKDFVTDVLNGFFIVFERQFEVGDYIETGELFGTVTNVGIRSTQIQSDEGVIYFIPNSEISIVSNYSRQKHRVFIDLPLDENMAFTDYHHQLTLVTQQLTQAMKKQFLQVPEILGVVETANNVYQYRIAYYIHIDHKSQLVPEIYEYYFNAFQKKDLGDE